MLQTLSKQKLHEETLRLWTQVDFGNESFNTFEVLLFPFLAGSLVNLDHEIFEKFVYFNPELLFLLIASGLQEGVQSLGLNEMLEKQDEVSFKVVGLMSDHKIFAIYSLALRFIDNGKYVITERITEWAVHICC